MDAECHVQVRASPLGGNGLFADKPIAAGETIARISRPLIGTLDLRHIQDTCANCFLMQNEETESPARLSLCTGCRTIRYCSKACQREAWRHIHKHECSLYKGKGSPSLPSLVRCVIACLLLVQHDTISGAQKREVARLSTFISEANTADTEIQAVVRSVSEMVKSGQSTIDTSEGLIRETVAMILVNAFTLIQDTLEPLGIAFDPLISTANHSCDPNAVVIFDGAQIFLRSTRAIVKDEEVCQAYVDVTDDLRVRQTRLQDVYGFTCACPLCVSQGKQVATPSDPELYSRFRHGYHTESPEKAIGALIGALRVAIVDQKYPETRQPVPSIYQELLSRSVRTGDYKTALLISIKQFFKIDPILYKSQFHVVRVVHAWTLVKLIIYVDSTYKQRQAVEQVQKDWGVVDFLIPLWRIVQQLKADVMKSHGPGHFAQQVLAQATELKQDVSEAGSQMLDFVRADPMRQWDAFESLAARDVLTQSSLMTIGSTNV